MQCGESLYCLLLFSPPKTFGWDEVLFEIFQIIWLQIILGGGYYQFLVYLFIIILLMTKNTTRGEWVQTGLRFKGGVNFHGRPIHKGFHWMGSFQNGHFIMSCVHDVLSVDNLGVLADGRMCHVSHLMSGILVISILEAESVTQCFHTLHLSP